MALFRLPADLKWLWLSCFLWMFGSGLYYFTLPVYAAQLGATPAQMGALFAVGFLAAAVCMIPSGWLAERFERRSIMIWAWWLGALAGPIYWFAPGWEWLIAGEVLNWGSATSLTAVQAYTLARDTTGRPTYTLSIVFSSFSLGMVVSPWLGGIMATHWGPRSVFALTTALYILSTLTLYMMRRQYPPARQGRRPVFGELRAALLGWAATGAPVRRAAGIIGLGDLLLAMTMALGQVYVADVTGAGYGTIGWLGSVASVGAGLLGPALGWAADRFSYRLALQAAALMFVAYAGLLLAAPGWAVAVTLAFLLRGAMEGTRALRATAVAAHGDAEEIGRSLSLSNLAWGVLGTAGSYLGGWLYQTDRAWPFWLTVAGGMLYVLALQAVRVRSSPV